MFRYIDNFLSEAELQYLKEISQTETTGDNVDHTVPPYQSHYNMHVKYQDNIMQSIVKKCEREISMIINTYAEVRDMWFNRTAEDSDYGWHNHLETKLPVMVLYIDGCDDRGTLFRIGEAEFTANVQNNSFLIFASHLEHRTQNWNGSPRMTMAITFNEK
jgi:hypothetical protein